jgi:hypothetical protein
MKLKKSLSVKVGKPKLETSVSKVTSKMTLNN